MKISLWFGLCALSVFARHVVVVPAEIPAGTVFHVRLTSPVSSQTSRVGDPISALLIAPVTTDAGVLPTGAILKGTINEVKPHSIDHQAELRLLFNRLEIEGHNMTIVTKVIGIDNAREKIDKTGLILGPSTQVDHTLGRIELLTMAVFVPELFAVDVVGSQIREGVHVDISYKAGVDFDIETMVDGFDANLQLHKSVPEPPLPESLLALIPTLPIRTSAGRPPRPADLINVVFIGSAEALTDAFIRAEWTTADALSARADVKTFFAVASREGYKNGPVSLQTMNGRDPDYVFQKQNNTFAMRHHVRIWRVGSWEGRPLWVGAGTHDIGVKFAVDERTFTHRVDGHIDLERDKIVNDLMFAGSPPASYVDRPLVPQSTRNATQDQVFTDGRIAVILLHQADLQR